MLQQAQVNLIMHGHKHHARAFWESHEDGSSDGRIENRREMLVVSGGTIGSEPSQRKYFANVIQIEPRLRGHDVHVYTLEEYMRGNAANVGTRAFFFDRRRISPVPTGGGFIEAKTFDEAYAKLARETELVSAEKINNLVIRIESAKDIRNPPAGYPDDAAGDKADGRDDLNAWFKDVVEWWQSPLIEAPNTLFTHGRRLKLHDGKYNADQIEAVSRILKEAQRTNNGRAVATLIDPETDTLGPAHGAPTSFPAFCLVQVHISSGAVKDRLNATAYFRKQEMRYWWPVNVAEIRLIMSKVAAKLKDVDIGSITTVTALAVWQKSRSRVSIPKVDRLYFGDHAGRASLLRMAAALAGPTAPAAPRSDRDQVKQLWAVVLDDIVPPMNSAPDNIPVAVQGIKFLRSAMEAQDAVATTEKVKRRLRDVIKALRILELSGERLTNIGLSNDVDRFQERLSEEVAAMTEARETIGKIVARQFKAERSPKSVA